MATAKTTSNPGAGEAIERRHGDMRDYMAPSLFQPHRVREALRDAHEGKIRPLIGYYAGLPSISTMRYVAPFGFDAAFIDWEHSAMSVETMTTMVHDTAFMSSGRTIPFVRIPGHEHSLMAFALDAGASLIVPQVNTVEQARHVVSAARFGLREGGTRSHPPMRYVMGVTDAPAYSGLAFHDRMNRQAAVVIQIETVEGIKNLDAILSEVEGIDAVWLGTFDARTNMNLDVFGGSGEEPEWLAAKAKFLATVKKHDKPYAGLSLFGPGAMKHDIANGMSMIFTSADTMRLMGLLGELKAAREVTGTSADAAA